MLIVINNNSSFGSLRTGSTGWLSSLLLDSPVRPQSWHRVFLPRSHSLSLSRSLLSDNCNLRFKTSTSCLRWPTSSRKLSSTSLVISNMADLRTVSMTTESWDWNVRKRASDIVLPPRGHLDAVNDSGERNHPKKHQKTVILLASWRPTKTRVNMLKICILFIETLGR